MKPQPVYRIATLTPVSDLLPGAFIGSHVEDAELVGFIATPEGSPEGSWEFFYGGDADPDDYPDARPVYAPITTDSTNKESN